MLVQGPDLENAVTILSRYLSRKSREMTLTEFATDIREKMHRVDVLDLNNEGQAMMDPGKRFALYYYMALVLDVVSTPIGPTTLPCIVCHILSRFLIYLFGCCSVGRATVLTTAMR